MQVSDYDIKILNNIAKIEEDIETLEMNFSRTDMAKSRRIITDMKTLLHKAKLRKICDARTNELINIQKEKKYLKEIKNICFLLQEPLYDKDNNTLNEIQKFSSNEEAILYIENEIFNNNIILKNNFEKRFNTLKILKDDRAISKLLVQICKEIDICKKEVYFIDDDTMTLQKMKYLFVHNPMLKEKFKNEYDTVFIKKELPYKEERQKIYYYLQTMYNYKNPNLMKLNDINIDMYLDNKNKLHDAKIKLMTSEKNAWELFKFVIQSANPKAKLNISDKLDEKLNTCLDFYLFDTLTSVYHRKNECRCILNTLRNEILNTDNGKAKYTYQFTFNKSNPENSILKINNIQINLTHGMYCLLNSVLNEKNDYEVESSKSQISKMNKKIKEQVHITDSFVVNPKREKIEQYKHLNYIIGSKFDELDKY